MKCLLFTSYDDIFFRTTIFRNVRFKNFVEQIKGYEFIKGLKGLSLLQSKTPRGWQTPAPPAYQGGKWMPFMRLKAITNDKRTPFYSNYKKYIYVRDGIILKKDEIVNFH